MEIDVAEQLRAPVGTTSLCPIHEEVESPKGEAVLVEGTLRFLRTDRGILVQGTLTQQVKLECSRCLTPFSLPLSLSIEEEYRSARGGESRSSWPEEAGVFPIDEDHIINLAEAVRQYSIMAIPMKPLCRLDCAGLCPRCGNNLNLGPCGCSLR